ncbi:unnamed protein product, partial [Brugia timori]|uniref:Secreted protein n=1 Tax=Brugia timori TaxID=42155 RepID=A0A0R3QG55_9BILA
MLPARQLADTSCPGLDVGKLQSVEPRILVVVEVARHRDVRHGRCVADHEATPGQMRVDDLVGGLRLRPQIARELVLFSAADADHEAQGGERRRE